MNVVRLLLVLLCFGAFSAVAGPTTDGVWRGTSSNNAWVMEITVKSTSFTGTLRDCRGAVSQISGAITNTGQIDTYINSLPSGGVTSGANGQNVRRYHLTGTLPKISFGGGSFCGVGEFVMQRPSP